MLTLLSILFSLIESIPLLLRHRLQKKLVVPSLWYFRSLQSKKTTDDEGGKNVSLKNWISILLIFLIAAAIINFIGFQQSFKRSVYIIDASANMQILEDEESRLEKALAAANRQIRTEKPNELMIIAAGLRPEVVSPFSTNPASWTEGLKDIVPVDCASDLSGAILAAKAALGTGGGTIYCFTDAQLEPTLGETLPDQFHWIRVPDETRNNVGIINVNEGKPIISKTPFFVDIKNYSLRPLAFDLVTSGEQGIELYRENIELKSLEKKRVFIAPNQFRQTQAAISLLTINLEIQDALALDNTAYGPISSYDLPNVYLVSTQRTFTPAVEVFANFYQYDFFQVDQGKFYALDITPQDIFVFDGFIPESPERYKGLVLTSVADFDILSQQYQLKVPPIHHPILEEVSWELFDADIFSEANRQEEPKLSSSSEKAFYQLLRIPHQQDRQWVILNKDIFRQPEAEGYHQEKEQVAYKLLFNALNFLSFSPKDNTRSEAFKCGEIVPFPPEFRYTDDRTFKLVLPGGGQKEIPGDQGFFLGEKSGFYTLEGADQNWHFALNLVDDRISSLEGQTVDALPEEVLAELDVGSNRSVQQKRPRAGLLLLIIVLLGIDWFYFYYQLRSKAKAD